MSPILTGVIASGISGNLWAPSGAYDSIYTATVTSDSTVNLIQFTSIPSTYTHLQIRMYSRSQRTQPGDAVYARFNGDSSNNYSRHQLTGDGSSTISAGYYPENVVFLGTTSAASSTANVFGVGVIDILDYANTTKNKTVRGLDGYNANGSGIVELRSHSWNSTSAVTSITIANYSSGDFFKAGTNFALYGIKGA